MSRFLKTLWAVLMLPPCLYVILTRPAAEPPLPDVVDLHALNANSCLRCLAGISAPHHYSMEVSRA